jgi:hypothetical protein
MTFHSHLEGKGEQKSKSLGRSPFLLKELDENWQLVYLLWKPSETDGII